MPAVQLTTHVKSSILYGHTVIRSYGHTVIRSYGHTVIRSYGRTVVRSHIQIFSVWWVTTILYNYGVRSASSVVTEAHTILEHCFTDSQFSGEYSTIERWYLNSKSFMVVSLILARFRKFVVSIEYHFNWYKHHTLYLKKTFPILENLFKTTGISTKVFLCLKIPLTSTYTGHFVSCENIIPQFRPRQFSPIPHPSWSPSITSLATTAEVFW